VKEDNIKDQAECFENTRPLPQRGKSRSVSGFALLSILERNRARSAIKRLSQSSSLILYIQRKPDFCYFHGICDAQRGDEN